MLIYWLIILGFVIAIHVAGRIDHKRRLADRAHDCKSGGKKE